MSKRVGKSKHSNDQEPTERAIVQDMRAVVRKLKKENERLRKELGRRGDVSEEYSELLQEVDQLDLPTHQKKDACPVCGTGTISNVDLGPRKFVSCSACKYRKVLK